jgi:predicted lipoprotein with Yx(FWY)xxD motif
VTEWVPLTAPGQPSSSDGDVQSKLGTVKRDDGTTQVTFGGLPLYTFVDDSAGQVTGNGESDSFGGTSFTWTVASTGGGSSAAAPSDSSSSGGSSGGY